MAKVIDFIPNNSEFDKFIRKDRDRDIMFLLKNNNLSREDAEDIYQESCIALYNNLRSGKYIQQSASLSTYLLQICRNMASNFLRDKNKFLSMDDLSRISSDLENDDDNYDDNRINEVLNLIDDEQNSLSVVLEQTEELVKKLPDPCNVLLWGKYWDRLSHQELSQMMGYSSANVSKTQTSRCLERFKKRVEIFLN